MSPELFEHLTIFSLLITKRTFKKLTVCNIIKETCHEKLVPIYLTTLSRQEV